MMSSYSDPYTGAWLLGFIGLTRVFVGLVGFSYGPLGLFSVFGLHFGLGFLGFRP